MPNDSSTGGYLAPTSSAPDNDAALIADLQAAVVGITGLAGTLILPRWQPEPAVRPPITTDWAALGTTKRTANTFATVTHGGAGEGSDAVTRHEEIDAAVSFYGPTCEGNASLLRDGLGLPQNREALWLQGIKLIEVLDLVKTADLINNQWWPRVDLTFRVRREIDRTYPILNLESGAITVATDSGIDLTVTPTA